MSQNKNRNKAIKEVITELMDRVLIKIPLNKTLR